MSNAKHLFVNLAKRQFINPASFAEPMTGRAIVNNSSGAMYAFALLISTPLNSAVSDDSHKAVDFVNVGLRINGKKEVQYFIGSWYGDPCVMASDAEKSSPLLTPYYMKQFPIPRYSRWNIYRLAMQYFEDLSMPMIETIKIIELSNQQHPIHSVAEAISMYRLRNGAKQTGSEFQDAHDVIVDVNIPALIDPNNPNRRKYMA